jgi:PBSX family phage terminase large subunit
VEVTIPPFKLNKKQASFVTSTRPWSAFIGGVGGGKTYSGAVRSVLAFIQEPGSLGIIAAPSYTMVRDTTMRMFFDLLPDVLVRSFNKNEMHLYGTNGSEVYFRSMDDPDKIRGINASWAWLDEAPYAGYYAWQMLKQRVGRQNVQKYKKRAWITGTPKGRDGYWQEFVQCPTEDHLIVRSSTFDNLKNLPERYIESMGLTGAFFQQEIMGSFEAFEGLVYQFNSDANDLTSHIFEIPGNKRFKKIFGGVDWGYTNPAVALVFGVDNDLRVYLIDEFYQRQIQLEDFIGQIIDMTAKYGVEDWWCDPAEPGHIDRLKDRMDNAMLPSSIWAADNDIRSGIQSVQWFLKTRGDGLPGLLVDPRCVNTISEFLSYQYDKKLEGGDAAFVKEKPKTNQADHAMDSLRYALYNEFGKERGVAMAVSASQYLPDTPKTISQTVKEQLPTPALYVDEDGMEIVPPWWAVDEVYEQRWQRINNSLRFLDRLQEQG